jgi:hypothetical protein
MRSRWALRCLGLLGVLAIAGTMASEASASSKTRKIRKQIRVFEAMTDQMLVDSPNWLVQSSEEARGSYIEGHGVVITFDASLVSASRWRGHKDHWWDWVWDDDERVIILESDSDSEEMDDSSKEWRDRMMKKQERLYTRGKVEITDTIMDFGDVLTFAKDDEWLEIEARLRRAEVFREKDIDRLTMKVKMADLRAYADGTIDEEALIKKIQVEES